MKKEFLGIVAMSLAIAALLMAIYTVSVLNVKLVQAESGDLNHDGVVDALDLSTLTSHWTK